MLEMPAAFGVNPLGFHYWAHSLRAMGSDEHIDSGLSEKSQFPHL